MKKTLKGKVTKIIYQGDGGYTIALVNFDKEFFTTSIKGVMDVEVNINYEFEGEMKDDDKFGEYFHVYKCEREKLTEKDQVLNYLTSKNFTGIGLRTATKIFNEFGEDTLEVIKNEPERLRDLGISEMAVQELYSKISTNDLLNDFYKELSKFGFTEFLIQEIYKYFTTHKITNPLSELRNQPFKYVDKINGFNFSKADTIFQERNDELDNEDRIFCGLVSSIENHCFQTGDTGVEKNDVQLLLENYVNLRLGNFQEIYEKALFEKHIFEIDGITQTKNFHDNEKAIATNINFRLNAIIRKFEPEAIDVRIHELENEFKINYSEQQKKAIKDALLNNISIISGGPGTGKTTIIKAIVTIFDEIKYKDKFISNIEDKIMLCAPTGRAAQRMKEATGFSARTIHSLLGWEPHTNKFTRGIEDPLPQELIIIDEFSMVDIFLANSLLKAIRPDTIIVIVGDEAQLESVNPGNVLGDLMNDDHIPSNRLDLIFRQGKGSTIAQLAKSIDKSEKIELISTTDMGVIEKDGNLIKVVKDIQDKSFKAGYDESEVQVLYPKYKGENGIDNLNSVLKPMINHEEKTVIYKDSEYQVGNKIMQLKNDYDKEIYNGDIGFITKILNPEAKAKEIVMEIEVRGNYIHLTKKDLENITHAYAISIHKAQGSEFKVVIVPIAKETNRMLTKKLLYTAISRAKDKLVIVGETDVFLNGIKNSDYKRKTSLINYLNNVINEDEDKSPFDFL